MIRLQGVDKESTLHTPTSIPQGAYVLADNPRLYEPQRANNFDLLIEGLDNIRRVGMVGDEENGTIPNAKELFRIAVNSSFVPHFSMTSIDIRRGNSMFKVAGLPTFDDGSATLNDYIGAETLDILMAWQNQAYDVETEKVGLIEDYKKDAWLVEYTPDWQVVRKYFIKGIWVSAISEDNFSREQDGKRSVSVTFKYDYAKLDSSEIE